jgi:two-component system chemotaxis response regulator CheY
MIVDDSLPMRMVIKKTIKASGFQVGEFMEASNGEDALRMMRVQSPDLVIVDYNMPGMDGLELINRMRAVTALQEIPVVVATVEGSKKRIEEFAQKGVEHYIHKPFTPEEIRDRLIPILGGPAYGQRSLDRGDEGVDF